MSVLLFHPRFVPAIEAGTKRQTIRQVRARPVRPGEPLSLRAWAGAAYRSNHKVLAEAVCRSVEPVRIDLPAGALVVEVSGAVLTTRAAAAFARADGFSGPGEMARWYRSVRSAPFEGVLIKWELVEVFTDDKGAR